MAVLTSVLVGLQGHVFEAETVTTEDMSFSNKLLFIINRRLPLKSVNFICSSIHGCIYWKKPPDDPFLARATYFIVNLLIQGSFLLTNFLTFIVKMYCLFHNCCLTVLHLLFNVHSHSKLLLIFELLSAFFVLTVELWCLQLVQTWHQSSYG